MNRKIEILAPAGSLESLIAAVNAGADAVYIGGDRFGARAYADNLAEDALLEAIDYVHLHGRKIYLTVNTLLKDCEIQQLYEYLLPYYKRGLDAVIVQDIGVMEYIRENFPGMAIHVSTQATVTGAAGARFFQEKGAERVVPAREIGLAEIKAMKEKTGLEIECFVHGALCYCYSGQCLMSSMIGGRSGNRGQCAQPCRLPYSIGQGGKQDVLSLKDLCTIDSIPELIEAGIDSFKIEGRMKQPEYVYTVVSMYRKYVDLYFRYGKEGFQVSREDRKILEGSYKRRGYTDGYYKRHNGKEMISFQRPKDSGEEAMAIPGEKIKEKINGKLILSKGKSVTLMLDAGAVSVFCAGTVVQQAQKQPLDRARIEKQMRKTGDTEFIFDTLDIEMEADVFLPMQAINELRREGMKLLEERILSHFRREAAAKKEEKTVADDTVCSWDDEGRLAVSVTERMHLELALKNPQVDTVYVDSSLAFKEKEYIQQREKGKQRLFLAMPYIFRDDTADMFEGVYSEMEGMYDGILIRNWESYGWLKKHGYTGEIRSDYNLYVFNQYSKKEFAASKIRQFTAPVELNYKELLSLGITGESLIIYGYQPVMISANCVKKSTGACTRKESMVYLKDRYKKKFAVRTCCRYCYNVIYNCQPLFLIDLKDEIKRLRPSELRIDFTSESGEEAEKILDLYKKVFREDRDVVQMDMDYTRGHFRRGVK